MQIKALFIHLFYYSVEAFEYWSVWLIPSTQLPFRFTGKKKMEMNNILLGNIKAKTYWKKTSVQKQKDHLDGKEMASLYGIYQKAAEKSAMDTYIENKPTN